MQTHHCVTRLNIDLPAQRRHTLTRFSETRCMTVTDVTQRGFLLPNLSH